MIPISDNYAVKFEKDCVILMEKYAKRLGKGRQSELSGEMGYQGQGYYKNLERVYSDVVDRTVRVAGKDTKDFKEVIDELKKLKQEIIDIGVSNHNLDK